MAIYNSRGDGGHAPSNDRRCPPSLSCVSGSAQQIARIRNACVREAPAAARPRRSRVRTGGRATDRDGETRGLSVRRASHEKRSETPRCPAKIHNACVREASRKAACARRGGQRTATAGGLPVRRDGQEKESETPRCQAKGLARPQGRGRTRALTAGAMGSGVGQRNGVASADASVATADRVAFPRVCCPRLRPSSPADSPSSSRYRSPALRVMLR